MTRPAWMLLTALLALTACGDDDDSNAGEAGGAAGSPGSSGSSGAAGSAGQDTKDECVAPECVALIDSGSVLAVAVDSQKRPIVVYTGDDKATSTFYQSSFWVRRLEGNTWVALGAPHQTGQFGIVGNPKLVVDASDRPIVAYGTSDLNLRAERYEGSSWTTLGDDTSTTLVAALFTTPTGLLALGGKLLLTTGSAFSSATSTWTPLPGAGIEKSFQAGALDGTTPLVIAGSASEAPQLYQHDGTAWVPSGGELVADQTLTVRALVVPEGGDPTALLAVSDKGTAKSAVLLQKTGLAWSAPQPIHPADDTLSYAASSMAASGSSLVVAYARSGTSTLEASTLFVRRLTGGTFTTVDTYTSSNTMLASAPRVAAHGNQAAITWSAPTTKSGFYIGYRGVTLP